MGKIIFIGLGLFDDKSLTLQALDACSKCDMLFMEQYTSILAPDSVKLIEGRVRKEIELVDRERVEDGSLLSIANDITIGLLVSGDPMTATTHVDLRIRADERGIDTEIIHGTSALVTIPGILGLQHYKFGRTVTLPFREEGFDPISPFEMLVSNLEKGLHTLALLDIRAEEKRYMSANEGLQWILSSSKKMPSSPIDESRLACVVARAGSPSCQARADSIGRLVDMDFGKPLHAIVVPGELHFEETEALIRFAKAPPELFHKG